MTKMCVWLCAALLLLSACGTGAISTDSAGSASGGGKASIDLAVAGDLQGTSTQLAKYSCAGGQYGTFVDSFNPIVNGSQYDLLLMLGKFQGAPTTYDFATGSNILLDFHNDKTGWRNGSQTTGTITIDAGGESGTVDAHQLQSGIGIYLTKVDLKFKFTCPVH